jgi:N-acetyl-anhydromuramyl-L-alanine amidase AmpD
MRTILFACLWMLTMPAVGQVNTSVLNRYPSEFASAYAAFPQIPVGTLEAVAITQTNMTALGLDEPESCAGLPRAFGLFGLVEDGQGYFRNNLSLVSSLSGYPIYRIKENPATQIMAYASALTHIVEGNDWTERGLAERLAALSALPSETPTQIFALESELYSVLSLLNDPRFMGALGSTAYSYSLETVFGENLAVLSAAKVLIKGEEIQSETGDSYRAGGGIAPCYNYASDVFVQTPSCNYSSRSGTAISAVTIHTVQGSYAGAVSWAQNCQAGVSYHYVVRRSDGQITQMLCEAVKGWHVGSENPYTIGIEHEGYVTDANNYTSAMYQASASLVRDITESGYGISAVRTSFFPWAPTTNYNSTSTPGSCVRIKGHQHFPNQSHTDPGQYWDWDYFFKLLNPNTPVTTLNTATGSFFDSGGQIGVYSNDERTLTLIQPTNASTVTVTFSQFDVEANWDYLYIYDGATVFSPLIGYYTGTDNPGTITSNNGALLFEFRSDCSTSDPGWAATWTSSAPDAIVPTVAFNTNTWETANFNVSFADSDNNGGSGVNTTECFSQVLDFNGAKWSGNSSYGFLFDDFASPLNAWVSQTGTWNLTSGSARVTDEANANTNLHIPVTQAPGSRHLYGWRMKLSGSGANRRAGMHFMCSDATLENRGESYFIYLRADANKCQIYRVAANAWTLMTDDELTVNADTWYDVTVVNNSASGAIRVYVNGALASEWIDPSPISSGNSISFRSGNCIAEFDDIRVYRSRSAMQSVSVGNANAMVRYQNPNTNSEACEIRSIIFDNAGNMSSETVRQVNIDWTPPQLSTLQDGLGPDINETQDGTQLHSSWGAAFDTNSGVSHYVAAMGDAPGATNVANWTNVGGAFSFTTPYVLVPYQWYYAQLKAVNNAGLESAPTLSDGQQYVPLTVGMEELAGTSIYPNPTSGIIHLPQVDGLRWELIDASGRMIGNGSSALRVLNLREYTSADGIYVLRMVSDKAVHSERIALIQP